MCDDRIAGPDIIRKHIPDGLNVEEGASTVIGEVEKIIFRNINLVKWGGGYMIAGDAEFYSGKRCFLETVKSGFPNSLQILTERGKDSNKWYFASIGGYDLRRIYHDSYPTTNEQTQD